MSPSTDMRYSGFVSVCVPIRNTADYSPFGVQQDGRTIQGGFYRYGYQGSEKDDGSKGGGNSYTTEFRQLDPRVGRWFSIDPKMSAWESPYVSMGNNPIRNNDILGDTVTVDPSISNNSDYKKAYDVWAATKEGKKFLRKFEVGGKYEKVSVVFRLSDKPIPNNVWTGADYYGNTDAYVVDKRTKIAVPFPSSSLYNAKDIALGKDKTSFLRLVVNLDVGQYLKSNYHKAKAVETFEHESQHIEIILLSLILNGIIPTPEKQHEEMSKGEFLEDRFNVFREIRFLWKKDYDTKWKNKRTEGEYILDKINNYEW